MRHSLLNLVMDLVGVGEKHTEVLCDFSIGLLELTIHFARQVFYFVLLISLDLVYCHVTSNPFCDSFLNWFITCFGSVLVCSIFAIEGYTELIPCSIVCIKEESCSMVGGPD